MPFSNNSLEKLKLIDAKPQAIQFLIEDIDLIDNFSKKVSDIRRLSPLLYNLPEKVLSDPVLREIFNVWLEDYYEKIRCEFERLSEKLIPVLDRYSEEIFEYLKKENFTNEYIEQNLSYLTMNTRDVCIWIKICVLQKILKFILLDQKVNRQSFVEKFGTVEKHGKVNLKLPIDINKYREEYDFVVRMNKTHVVPKFWEIKRMHIIYNPKKYREQKEKLDRINQLALAIRYNSLDSLINPAKHSDECKGGFDVNDLKLCIEIVCFEFKKALKLLLIEKEKSPSQTMLENEEKEATWSFDDSDGKLQTPFGVFSIEGMYEKDLLGLFFPNGIPMQKAIHRNDIWNEIFSSSAEGNRRILETGEKSQVYNTRGRINKKTKDMGFELLDMSSSMISLNPIIFE